MKLKNCDVYQLKKIVSNKKLICFGMGKVLHDFLEDFSAMRFEKDIYAIADNKAEKDGGSILLNGIPVKTMSPEDLTNLHDIVILISCADIAGVYEQLEKYKLSDNIDCYAVYFVRSQTNQIEKSRRNLYEFKVTKEQKIPKIIHYCWFGHNPIPEKNRKWMDSWRKYCPDYEIIEWNENNYDITKNTYMYEAYKAKYWSFVSDFARLDVVYQYGGIYLDTDVELIRSYDELLYQAGFAGIEAVRKIALGLGFGAEKGHSMIKELMELYEDIHFLDKAGNKNLMTCVTLQDPLFKKKGFVNDGNYQIVDGLTIYPEEVLAPKCFYTGKVRITENTFSIHHYDGSWALAYMQKMEKNVKLLEKVEGNIG